MAYEWSVEETTLQTLALDQGPQHQTEIIHLLAAINSVDCYFKIALNVTCISLNDVNSSDWTIKQSFDCLMI